MVGLICGGATASVDINKSIGLVTLNPSNLLSETDIFAKIFLIF